MQKADPFDSPISGEARFKHAAYMSLRDRTPREQPERRRNQLLESGLATSHDSLPEQYGTQHGDQQPHSSFDDSGCEGCGGI